LRCLYFPGFRETNAAHMLIQDGCDALDVLGWTLEKAAR
jgi:riboflavin synthase